MIRNPFKSDPVADALKAELVQSQRNQEAARLSLIRSTAKLLRKLDELPIEEGIEGFGRDLGKRGE